MESAGPFVAMVVQQLAQVGLMEAAKMAMSTGITTFAFTFYSSAFSTIILIPLSFFVHRSAIPPLLPTFRYGFFLLGIMGFLMQTVGFLGLKYSSPLLSSAILQLTPGFTFILAVILRIEKFEYKSLSTVAKSVGTLTSIIGALVATLYKGPQVFGSPLNSLLTTLHFLLLNQSSTWVIGGLLMIITSVITSAFIISQALVLKKYPAELIVMLFYSCCVTILCGAFALATERNWNSWSLSPRSRVMALLYSSFFGNVFQVSISLWCVKKRGPLFVVMFHPLSVVIAMVLSIFLGETIYIGSVVGSTIIVVGFYSVLWGKSKERKMEERSLGSNSNNIMPLLQDKVDDPEGIRGPSYKFPNGNDTEIRGMLESNTGPMELTHDIFSRLQPHFHSWIKLYGRTFLVWHGSEPELVVTDVELIKEILSNKEGALAQRKFGGPLVDLFGNGLPFSEGQKWSKLRKVAEYAFHGQSLKDMIPAMIGSAEAMLKTWKSYEGKEIEVYEQFRRMSAEVISKTAFGSSYLEGKHIFQMLDKLSLIIYKSNAKIGIPGINNLFKTAEDIESGKLREALRDSIMLMLKKREDNVKTGQAESYGGDFLGSLLKAHHDADVKVRISVDDIIDECKTFYFAAHETTTNLLSWSVLLLAIHPEWQEKARKEVLELCGQDNPKTDSISRLHIVGMILNETLRLYPPVIYLLRRATRKTRLGGLTIPAGLGFYVPPLSVQSSCELWGEDAHLFKPERFAEGVAKATRDQLMAFLPFGFGPRKCVGMNFANMEAKIALTMILQRYKFTLSQNYTHSPTVILNLQPKQGVQVMLSPL
ncbi:hypothetical protein HAX54_024612 [Datura stramonium]|uniref:WAT1-related protein n=1 Tax=Datura stramonium TaxID=4076 RepID=A0ABS8RGR9_DATST|nr:hypothetical protein [Datura stramonium]